METGSLIILLEQGQEYFIRPVADQVVLASMLSVLPQVLLGLEVGVQLVAHALRVEH